MIEAREIHKTYREGERAVEVLRGVNLSVTRGKKIGIVGASGAGKSTLLHILGGLDSPTAGNVLVPEGDLYRLPEKKRAVLRNQTFGFVFQFYHLLPELTVWENVMLPAWIGGFPKTQARAMAQAALERVGLADRADFLPARLSGGEQQRAALARAVSVGPKVILADEPTGNLDETTGKEVMDYLFEVAAQAEGSLVLVTHNRSLLAAMDETFELKHGVLHPL